MGSPVYLITFYKKKSECQVIIVHCLWICESILLLKLRTHEKKIAKLRFQRSNYLCLCAVVHSPSLTCEVRELNEKKYWIGLSSLLLCRARTCIFWQISTKKNFVNGFCYGLFLKDFIEIYWIKTMESAYSKF